MASASNSLWSTLWLSVLRPALIGGLFVLGLGVACSDQSKLNSAQLSVSSNNPTPDAMGPCPDGLRRECGVTLGRQGDVVNCAKGAQLCSAGKWGTCEETSKFDVSATASGSPLKTLSLSMPVACVNNPCDPACRVFLERPAPAYSPTQTQVPTWKTGSLIDYPTNTLAHVEPCSITSDCQAGLECDQVLQSCVRHVAGETDASCATFDLIVAPTCQANGVSTVPVCNRGSMSAPAGVKVVVLDPGQIRTLNPSTAAPSAATCLTPQPIPPGKCIDVIGCGAIANGSEIMVNPQDGLEKPECEVTNNWSVYQNGACNQAICQAGKATGVRNRCEIPLRGVQNVGTDLLGRWPLNEVAGSAAVDVSGRTNNLAVDAGATWPTGRLGGALLISAVGPKYANNDSVDLGDTARVGVALWMKNNGANDYDGGLVSHLDSTTFEGWQIQRTATGRIQVELGAAGTTTEYNATLAPNDNNWHHVAFTWDGSTGALRVYLDGILTEAVTHSSVMTLGAGARRLSIGRSEAGAFFSGAIDDVSIYRGALSGDQVYLMAQSSGATVGVPPYARTRFTPRVIPPPPPPPPAAPPTCPAPAPVPYQDPAQPQPDAPWYYWGNKCYANLLNPPETFDARRTRCTDLGGDLVSLNRPEELAFVYAKWGVQPYVIGARDEAVEGTWRWGDNSCFDWLADTATHGDNPWADGQPDGGTGQNCAYVNPSLEPDHPKGFRDLGCGDSNDDWSVICEHAAVNPPGACAAGQLSGPSGSCYEFVNTAVTYAAAQTSCLAKGAGWKLVEINDTTENDFVAGNLNCMPAWVGSFLAASTNYLSGEPNGVAGSNCLQVNSLGKWLDSNCAGLQTYVCEGPPPPPPPPPPLPPIPNGPPEDLTLVSGSGACSAGANQYYLDDPVHPTLATLCPSMCPRLVDTPGDAIYEFGCPAELASRVETVDYTSSCPNGTQVQWSFLVYNAITPGSSSVQFDVRTAETKPQLAAATFQTVALAQLTPTDTQRCWYGDSCQVDLFDQLGMPNNRPDNRYPELQLRITLTPGAARVPPQLKDWDVTYSCQPSQ